MKKGYKIGILILTVMMVMLTACKKDKAKDGNLVAKIDDVEISLDEAKFYAYMEQANYEAYYIAYGQEVDWKQEKSDEDGNKVTLEKLVIDESMDIIYKQKLFKKLAQEWNISLDEEDEAKVAEEVSNFFTDSDDKLLNKIGADKDMINKIYRETQLYTKVSAKILADNPVNVTDEDAKQGHYLVVILDESKVSSPKSTAEAILGRVKNGEEIEYVADKYGLEVTKGNVGKGDMEGNALETLSLSLKTGESGMCEVGNYCYVVYCDNDNDVEATALAKEEKQNDAEAEVIKNKFESLKEQADIKVYDDILKKISFGSNIFTLKDVQQQATTEQATTEQATK